MLLGAALRWGPVPVDVLRDRFVELDRDPDTLLPFSFDHTMIILTDRLYDEFVLEARKENSRIQPLVNEELLSASREHHAVLRELMLSKPRLGVTAKEALLESKARCAVRWRALGINQEVAVALATDPEVGAPPPDLSEQLESTEGGVSILTAEIGVGKSLMLERIHQRALYRFNEASGAPVPVFLRARNVDGSLRGAVTMKVGPMGDTSSRGCLLCLDGVEEVGYSRALELLEEARELIYVWPGTTAMITSRPMSGFGFEEELVPVQPLSEEEAEELAGRFSSDATPFAFPHDWPESLRNAVRRPLFSILVGLDWAERRGDWHRPRSLGELLARLVERALQRTNFEDAEEQLQRLAMLATDRGRSPVQTEEVASPWQARSLRRSGLVMEDEQAGTITFSLPILEEWFAAGAMASEKVNVGELADDPIRLERWRYPLAIAVGTLRHEAASRLLLPIVHRSPANAAKIVDDGLAEYGRVEAGAEPSAEVCVRRIRQTMAAWIEGLGPLAALIAPVNEVSRAPAWEASPPEEYPIDGLTLAPLGVRLAGNNITALGWYRASKGDAEVLEVPAREDRSEPPWHWPRVRLMFAPGRQLSWAWRHTLDELAAELSELLKRRKLPLDDGLPAAREHAWLEARVSSTGRRVPGDPICTDDLQWHLDLNDPDTRAITFERPGLRPEHFYPRYLRAELRRMQAVGRREMYPPWPTQDLRPDAPELHRPDRNSVATWALYSPERLLERARVVFEGMLETYRWIVQRYFPHLAPAMPTWTMLPARVIGVLYYGYMADTTLEDKPPILCWYLDPLGEGAESEVAFRLHETGITSSTSFWDLRPFSQDAVIEAARRGRAMRPHSAAAITAVTHYDSGVLYSAKAPIQELTYETLWWDLQQAGWVRGNFNDPQ